MGQKGSRMSEQSQIDYQFLLNNTSYTPDELRELYELFMRKFPQGHMSKGELLMLCRKIPHIPEGFASHVTRVFDRNRNGVVDLQEFLITIHEFVKGTPEQRLGLYFRLCDLNGNGTIDKKEMVKMFGMCKQAMSTDEPSQYRLKRNFDRLLAKKDAKELFKTMDVNKDKCLSLKEFVNGCLEQDQILEFLRSFDYTDYPSITAKNLLRQM